MRLWTLLAASIGALAWSGAGATATPPAVTITASDGTQLACGLVEPDGSPPAGGWPGIVLFHGSGQTHADMDALAAAGLAPAGYASLACDARGTGASGGAFGLDGPRDVEDARDLYDWLAARPEVSDTRIGAVGLSLGGALVWNATAAGVPFKAIVPTVTWTSLAAALAPQGVVRIGLLGPLASGVPLNRWDPSLAAAGSALLGGTLSAPAKEAANARSVARNLSSLSVPTLLIQGRHDFVVDLDQALSAYRQLRGPKALYVGDLGHAPAANPPGEQRTYIDAVVAWLDRYVKEQPGAPGPSVVLAHDPWDGTTTGYAGLPPTTRASVALPGSTTLRPATTVSRGARLTGGPHETFGGGTVTVRYSGAKDWPRLVATVSVAGDPTPVTVGAAPVTGPAGVVTIHLLDECVLVPGGAKLVVTLAATSAPGWYTQPAPAGSTITVGRETLQLSLLRRAVSR